MGYIGERNLQQEVNNKIDDKIKLIMVRKIDEVWLQMLTLSILFTLKFIVNRAIKYLVLTFKR